MKALAKPARRDSLEFLLPIDSIVEENSFFRFKLKQLAFKNLNKIQKSTAVSSFVLI